jgi:outer membrane lipoprotein-sorting protein
MSCLRNTVMRVTGHVALIMLVCALVFGCTTTPVPVHEEAGLKQATAEELATLLRQRETAIRTMKGLFSAKVRGGLIPISTRVEGAVYYRRPNSMRLRGFTPIGGELFEFVQADELYMLRLPTMGRVLSGRQSDMSEMGKLARPFELSVWAMGGVLGTSAIGKDETTKLVEEGARYRLDVFGPRPGAASTDRPLLRRMWFDRRTLLVVQEERLNGSGETDASIQYEDFRSIGETALPANGSPDARLLRPFKISLEDGRGQGSVQVTFHEIISNQELKSEELGRVSRRPSLPESAS